MFFCLTAVGQYEVGDVGPAGGWIFYVDSLDEFDWDYLEASSTRHSATQWGGLPDDFADQSISIGAGQVNTSRMLFNRMINGSVTGNQPAATLVALTKVQNGIAGWFLPSASELFEFWSVFQDSLSTMYNLGPSTNTQCYTSSYQYWDFVNGSPLHYRMSLETGEFGTVWDYTGSTTSVSVLPIRQVYAEETPIPIACGQGTIWDEVSQTCIVANPSDSNFDGCVQLNDLLDLLSAYGDCAAEESPWQCGDPLEYQGYDYETVQIGEQCWFAENLRSENYDNGDAIPSNLGDSEWQNTTSGAVAVYGEDEGCFNNSPDIDACDPAQSLEEYGRLYNWHAVDDARGLCPSGWHVPTDGEWTLMTDELGGESIAGGEMKATYGWYNGGNGTNSSGFSGLPGDSRSDIGSGLAGFNGFWWSSSPDGSSAWYRSMSTLYESIYRDNLNRFYGFSVRCVRDAE